MVDQRDKVLSYHRAEYFVENSESIKLSACLREAYASLPEVEQRTTARADGQNARLAIARDGTNKSIFLHITLDTPGERASVIPAVKAGTSEIKVSTVNSPSGTEFMDGDAFLYVVGNHICVCMSSLRIGAVRTFLQDFLGKAKIRKDAAKFDIQNALDINKVQLIQEVGVKRVVLKGGMYAESAHYLKRKKDFAGSLGYITKHIRALVGAEHDVQQDALQVNLIVDVDEREKGKLLGFARITALASDLVTNQQAGDDYLIILRNGDRISPDDIMHKTTVKIPAIGKSVDRDIAWTKLEEYYRSLVRKGIHVQ